MSNHKEGPAPRGGGDTGGKQTHPNHKAERAPIQGSFAPVKATRPRHVRAGAQDRGRLHDLLRAIHNAIFADRGGMATSLAGLAARRIANGGLR